LIDLDFASCARRKARDQNCLVMESGITDHLCPQMQRRLNLESTSNSSDSAGFKPRLNVNWKEIFEGVDDDKRELPDGFLPPPSFFRKRKSITADRFDPGDEDEKLVVRPKTDEQRRRLGDTIKKIFLFQDLNPIELKEIFDAMFEKRVDEGEVVIHQGNDGDNFYIVDEGTFDIFIRENDNSPAENDDDDDDDKEEEEEEEEDGDEEVTEERARARNEKKDAKGTRKEKEGRHLADMGQHKGTIIAGGFFGELALMYNQPRAASIVSTSPGVIWGLDRKTFRRIIVKHSQTRRKLFEDIFQNVPMLAALSKRERMSLCDALQSRHFENGDVIVKQGDLGFSMFFIEDGEVTVSATKNGEDRHVTTLSKGDYFGELALVTQQPRAATVTASSSIVALAELQVQAFERLLGPCMNIMKRNVQLYNKQLKEIFSK